MIRIIPGVSKDLFPDLVDAMFRCRAQAFHERLGWDVVVKDGYERDSFDEVNPLYIVAVNPVTGEYWGSIRIMPTTGPNMLRDVFSCLLDEGEIVESATIWEASRICAVSKDGQPERGKGCVNYVVSEMLVAICELAPFAGLTQIVGVCDAPTFRVLRTAGCEPQMLGTPRRIGETMCYVGLFDTGADTERALRQGPGIEGSVLAPGAKDLILA